MSPELTYFLKVNIAFMLFYAFYRLFFYKDTFFKLRRSILLILFLVALVYPLMNFQEWVKEQEPIADVILLYTAMLPETTIVAEPVQTMDWHSFLQVASLRIYWLIVAFFLIRFFIQLGSILWLALKSKQSVICHTKVYLLNKLSGPFSFFKLIFIHPASHSEKELDEILIHERTHASQWHSIDVIISELICILCWMNPFVWLLKREVRHNLEYLADNTVLQSGYDSKSYQYHLLGLAHQTSQAAANLYNNFNVLHLKNRISMMNKKRTQAIGRTKYLMFIPLATLLMLLSNIEAVARITKDLAERTGTTMDTGGSFMAEVPAASEPEVSMPEITKEEIPVFNNDVKEATTIHQPDNTQEKAKRMIFTVVENMPEFPGGETELLKFINRNIKYPVSAQEQGIQGRVVCAFVVNEDGRISDAEVLRGVSPDLDEEAMRVVSDMPVWKPGEQRGNAVAVKYTVPITFRLQDGETSKTPSDTQQPDDPNKVYTVVDDMPKFPGGETALLNFINQNIKYPVSAQERKIKGRVVASYIVEKDGSLSNFKVERGVDPDIDEEAIRVLKLMPKWEPGKIKGKEARVKYTVPVTFRLQ